MRRRTLLLPVVLLAVALVAAGCTAEAPDSSRPAPTFRPCGQDGQARCASVSVPANWTEPDGAQLRLNVLVLPAQTEEPATDALFYLAGFGATASGDIDVAWAAQTFREVNRTRDLVFVDQRGTGRSAPQTCPGTVQDYRLEPEAVQAAVRDCLAAVDRDPRHDTTPAAVRDLEAVRKALGYDRVNLYGISYGVSLGLAYLQRHDQRVRTAVFDSGSLLDVPLWQQVPTSAQASFDQLAARCAADAACAAAYSPTEDLAAVVAALRAQPAQVPVGAETVTVELPTFLNSVIDGYLADPETAVLLPGDLHALVSGQWAAVLAERGAATQPAADEPVVIQTLTIRCGDAWARLDAAAVGAQPGSMFTPATAAVAAWQQTLCSAWPHDPGASGTVHSSVPVVFLNGTADPADPPANVATAPRTMPHALLVDVPGWGHGVLLPGCLQGRVNVFVETGDAGDPRDWTVCAATLTGRLPAFPPPS